MKSGGRQKSSKLLNARLFPLPLSIMPQRKFGILLLLVGLALAYLLVTKSSTIRTHNLKLAKEAILYVHWDVRRGKSTLNPKEAAMVAIPNHVSWDVQKDKSSLKPDNGARTTLPNVSWGGQKAKMTGVRNNSLESTEAVEAAFHNVLQGVQKDHRLDMDGVNSTKLKMKKILYWTSFRGRRDYGFGVGHETFVNAKCKVSMCTATYSHTEVADADAVLFHIPDFNHDLVYPPTRLPHQLYAMFVRECPAHIQVNNQLQKFKNFFNMSILYSREADVLFPYGMVERREADTPYIPYNNSIMKNKTKFALAIISNCRTGSKRETIIDALREYIPIDVLGGCSTVNISQSVQICQRSWKPECMRKIISEYKYYFSFESFLCRDYASEKLYKVLDLPVIPVVYGGSNYSELLPPRSFIDVRDFKTAASLAAYLEEVAADTDKFLTYFTWRRQYKQTVDINMKPGKFLVPDPRVFCDLCEYLHVNGNRTKVISDVTKIYGKDKYCVDPGDWLTGFLEKNN